MAASRGIAAIKFLEGNSEEGFYLISSIISDLSELEYDCKNVTNHKLQLIYDLYRFGEYNEGLALLEKEFDKAKRGKNN